MLQLSGYCEIPLWETVPDIGCNCNPETRLWRVCGYTVVDSDNYYWLNQWRWRRQWVSKNQSYYAVRDGGFLNGQRVIVSMARQILGLPLVAGRGGDQADHIKQDQTLRNTRDNLRVATHAQNMAHTRKKNNTRYRFKGIVRNGPGFVARVGYNSQSVRFPTVRSDVEAALMYNYSAYLLYGDFTHLNQIPDHEIPSEARQWELYDMVVKKLTGNGLLTEELVTV